MKNFWSKKMLACKFLAAMSSSRSDGVTQSVRLFVTFFSFSVFGVCSAFGMSTGLSKVSKGCFSSVLRKFQGYFKKVSRVFQESFKGVSRKCQGSFKEVSREFQGSSKGVSRKFQGCFKEVSRTFKKLSRVFQRSFKVV